MKQKNRKKLVESIKNGFDKILRRTMYSASAASAFISLINFIVSLKIAPPVIISALSVNYLFGKVSAYWIQIPSFFDSIWNRIICTLCVAMFGIAFYVLRQRHRKIYASIEFGAGLGLAYYATTKLPGDQKTDAALAALLGCVYIIVRACDNFMQSKKQTGTV